MANKLSATETNLLLSFVRRRIFNVWRGVLPSLSRLHCTFEIFNPANGANMGWHQDGHPSGTFIAHYALPSSQNTNMNWFEVALPPSENGCEPDDAQYALELFTDHNMIGRINPHNFVPFPFDCPSQQRIVVLEDAACYHRTPLTAHAVRGLQQEQHRPIARFVFYGVCDDGSAANFSGLSAAPDGSTTQQNQLHLLPDGLHQAVDRFALQTTRRRTFEEALALYVAGDPDVVEWLRESSKDSLGSI